jgi:hypothetical protein
MPEQPVPLDCWAVVEVMGHKRFAGHVTEQLFGSAALIRVDVPETEQPASQWDPDKPARTTPAYSKLIGVGSIYCITPCTEEVARVAAKEIERYNNPIPVEMPGVRQIPASVSDDDDDEDPRW